MRDGLHGPFSRLFAGRVRAGCAARGWRAVCAWFFAGRGRAGGLCSRQGTGTSWGIAAVAIWRWRPAVAAEARFTPAEPAPGASASDASEPIGAVWQYHTAAQALRMPGVLRPRAGPLEVCAEDFLGGGGFGPLPAGVAWAVAAAVTFAGPLLVVAKAEVAVVAIPTP